MEYGACNWWYLPEANFTLNWRFSTCIKLVILDEIDLAVIGFSLLEQHYQIAKTRWVTHHCFLDFTISENNLPHSLSLRWGEMLWIGDCISDASNSDETYWSKCCCKLEILHLYQMLSFWMSWPVCHWVLVMRAALSDCIIQLGGKRHCFLDFRIPEKIHTRSSP